MTNEVDYLFMYFVYLCSFFCEVSARIFCSFYFVLLFSWKYSSYILETSVLFNTCVSNTFSQSDLAFSFS